MKSSQTAYFYDEALMPPTFTICGMKLRPFCLGHFLILRQLKSPLNGENEIEVNFTDGIYWLFHALIVCALSYEDNLELLNDDDKFASIFKEFSDKLVKNMELDKNWNIHEKLMLFKQYMAYFMEMPMYTGEGEGSTKAPSGTDWCSNIFVIFKSHLGYTESEILNMNFRKLFYEWCNYAEENGAIQVSNKTTLAQHRLAKQRQ